MIAAVFVLALLLLAVLVYCGGLGPLWRAWQLVYFTHALKSRNHAHPDASEITLRITHLLAQRPHQE